MRSKTAVNKSTIIIKNEDPKTVGDENQRLIGEGIIISRNTRKKSSLEHIQKKRRQPYSEDILGEI